MIDFGPSRLNNVIGHFESGQAVLVGFEIAEIANVAFFGFGTGVGHISGIEVAACGIGVGGAAVSELMNVKSVRTWRQALDVCGDSNPVAVFGES